MLWSGSVQVSLAVGSVGFAGLEWINKDSKWKGQEMGRELGTHCQRKFYSLPGMLQPQQAPDQKSAKAANILYPKMY